VAHSEACQLYIEQEIKAGLAQGKTPYSIGKELAAMVEKMFEASIPMETLKDRAYRIQKKIGGNQPKSENPVNHSENQEKRPNQVVRDDKGKYVEGKPPGPGRLGKYEQPPGMAPGSPKPVKPVAKAQALLPPARVAEEKSPEPYSDAVHFAIIALSQLDRIRNDDPRREEALQMILEWLKNKMERRE